ETLVEGVEITEKENDREIVKLIRFLRRVPRDPMTNSTEWGKRSYQDDPDTQSWGGQNVYDVSTRSPGTGLDGTKYTDW
ncbi:MAG: general secretion pathway protein GspG, partial [Acidobacteria bacterium]|nr:general secretion pathway protein GspG [Acidobacteriota bacterium]